MRICLFLIFEFVKLPDNNTCLLSKNTAYSVIEVKLHNCKIPTFEMNEMLYDKRKKKIVNILL